MQWLRKGRDRRLVRANDEVRELLEEVVRRIREEMPAPNARVVESVIFGGFISAGVIAGGVDFKHAFPRSTPAGRRSFVAVCSVGVLARWLGLPPVDGPRRQSLATLPDTEWVYEVTGAFGEVQEAEMARWALLIGVGRDEFAKGYDKAFVMDTVIMADALALLEGKPLPKLPGSLRQINNASGLADSGFPVVTWNPAAIFAFRLGLGSGTRRSFEYFTDEFDPYPPPLSSDSQ